MRMPKLMVGGAVLAAGMSMFGVGKASAAELIAQTQIAVAPPAFLRMEITSACIDGGAVFNLTNRGGKWPRTGYLKLYYADDKTLIGKRRLRLAGNQRVSFVVKDKILAGRPVAVWVEPEWYQREFEYDASMNCSS